MNIAQMSMSQMKRVEGKRPAESLSGVSEQSSGKDKSKSGDFSKVLGNTLEKTETCKPKSCKAANGRNELQKPVNESADPETEADKVNTEITGSDETDRMLFLQMADLLKLLGISVDGNDALSQNGDLVQETLSQQEQARIILQEPSAGKAVLRLVKMLERLTGNGDSNNVTTFLQELKSLAEAQLNGLTSSRDEKFLTKLVKVLEKALGEYSAQKTDSAASTVGAKNLVPVIETVSDNSSAEGASESETFADNQKMHAAGKLSDMNIKGSESFGSEAGQNGKNGFSLHESELINSRDVRPVMSGHGFNAVDEALGNEQPTPVYKLTQSIFGQIAQKAKVIVLPGVTEMQIQLKPGFLGKLNMSISSENGSVTARFSAETQAVKGIIEANLNSLKDALNQQGIKVDQLVVDIGTHNHQPGFEQRQNMYRGHNGSKNNRISVNSEEVERMFSTETQSGVLKSYYGSTVEFTA